jgi:hypothetical protein
MRRLRQLDILPETPRVRGFLLDNVPTELAGRRHVRGRPQFGRGPSAQFLPQP